MYALPTAPPGSPRVAIADLTYVLAVGTRKLFFILDMLVVLRRRAQSSEIRDGRHLYEHIVSVPKCVRQSRLAEAQDRSRRRRTC